MTVSNTTPVPETTPIYIGTDGGGPGTVFRYFFIVSGGPPLMG